MLGARVYNKASDGKSYVPEGEYHRLGRLSEHLKEKEELAVQQVCINRSDSLFYK